MGQVESGRVRATALVQYSSGSTSAWVTTCAVAAFFVLDDRDLVAYSVVGCTSVVTGSSKPNHYHRTCPQHIHSGNADATLHCFACAKKCMFCERDFDSRPSTPHQLLTYLSQHSANAVLAATFNKILTTLGKLYARCGQRHSQASTALGSNHL